MTTFNIEGIVLNKSADSERDLRKFLLEIMGKNLTSRESKRASSSRGRSTFNNFLSTLNRFLTIGILCTVIFMLIFALIPLSIYDVHRGIVQTSHPMVQSTKHIVTKMTAVVSGFHEISVSFYSVIGLIISSYVIPSPPVYFDFSLYSRYDTISGLENFFLITTSSTFLP